MRAMQHIAEEALPSGMDAQMGCMGCGEDKCTAAEAFSIVGTASNNTLSTHACTIHTLTLFLSPSPYSCAELRWQGPLLVDTALRMVTGAQEQVLEAATTAATSLILALEVSPRDTLE
jgi:hypothetical protein